MAGGARRGSRRTPERVKFGGGNVKILLPETELQGLAGSGEQSEGAAGAQVMKEPAPGKQSQLDDEKEHVRLSQPGWHERKIRDVSPGGSLIACSSRLIVKLLLTGAGLFFY